MSSIALSLCVALGTFPATAFADDANATTITKAYVDKATYTPGEAATIYVDVDGATGTKTAHIQITQLNETIWENDVTFTAEKRQSQSVGLRRQRIIRDIWCPLRLMENKL